MNKREKYILMYQDEEVLSFAVTFGKKKEVEVLEKLAHFDKAPYGMKLDTPQGELNNRLLKLLRSHMISSSRSDAETILKYTGYQDLFELSFQGHGLSLSDHYWHRKENEKLKYNDINFFTNKWDDSFARAVLSGNYEALKNASLHVPDLATSGWAVKGWLYEEDGPKLYKLGIDKDHFEESLTEVLVSRLARRMFKDNEAVEYELKKINGKYASVSKVMLTIDEELVPLSVVLPEEIKNMYQVKNKDREINKSFFEKIKEFNLPGLYQYFVKLSCLRSLCFINDLHFDNLSIIRNLKTGEIRPAPLFDLAGAFGSGTTGKKIISNINKATYLLVYYIYGNLDENWDYSWYDPKSLIGFDKEIEETLSISDFYTKDLIANILDVYYHQKDYLDELANKSNNKA